jgi:hypothetical protein
VICRPAALTSCALLSARQAVVDAALEFAGVTPADVFYDIGCNDGASRHLAPLRRRRDALTCRLRMRSPLLRAGRVCVAAARRGARCVGLELDATACGRATAAVDAGAPRHALPPKACVSPPHAPSPPPAGVTQLVRIVHGNALEADLSDATVVFLYLLPKGNARIAAKLAAELRPGARIVTHMFRLPAEEWEARLLGTQAVGSCRPGGVDTSAFTKLYIYAAPGAGGAQPAAASNGT